MKLKVISDGDDLTLKMADLSAEATAIDLTQDEIYIAYHKPIKNIYVELEDRAVTDELVLQYWNGSAFVDVENINDYTFGLTESGLITWDEAEHEAHDYDSSGIERYWLKLTTATPAAISIHGINLILSSDRDLSFVPGLSAYLPDELASWVSFHQEATSQVVQYLRNSGKYIKPHTKRDDEDEISLKQIDQFDLLDIFEFKNAAKYYALYLIYDHISKSDEDNYAKKSARAYEKYLENINMRLISIDDNDNGETDNDEKAAVQFTRVRRE
jgi:hypothetical protein